MSETLHAEPPASESALAGPALKSDPSLSAVQHLHVARRVARKALSLSAMDDSLGESGGAAGEQMEQAGGGGGSAADVASQGFSGAAQDVPHRAKMEQSFGQSFGGVKAYTDEPARKATESLGAHAYAMGNQVAFNKKDPDEATVAHELTHVLQHTGQGPARKADSGGDGGIDVSGEGEAEQVEAAVAAGKPARSVWEGGAAGAEGGAAAAEGSAAAGGEQAATGAGPARKAKGPALSNFTMGMTFSPSGLEKSYEYTLWDRPPFRAPIAAVPGLFGIIEPSVKVKAAGGVDWRDKTLKAAVGVEGGVLIGFEYGNKDVVGLYGGLETKVSGGFEYAKSSASWSLDGTIKLSSNFAIGCKIAGGILDYKFEFGKVDPICTFAGLKWEKGKPFNAGVFSWGPQVLEFFNAVRRTIDRAQQLIRAGADAARAAYNRARQTARGAYNTGRDVVNWVTSW